MKSTTILGLLNYENPVLRNYAICTALLIIKTGLMSILTAVQLIRTMKLPSPEDPERQSAEAVVTEKLDRVRRAHHNDLENNVPIIIIMFLYVLTNPLPGLAISLFWVIFAFRVWHTIVYAVYVVRQPARFIGFIVPFVIMLGMSIQVFVTFAG